MPWSNLPDVAKITERGSGSQRNCRGLFECQPNRLPHQGILRDAYVFSEGTSAQAEHLVTLLKALHAPANRGNGACDIFPKDSVLRSTEAPVCRPDRIRATSQRHPVRNVN